MKKQKKILITNLEDNSTLNLSISANNIHREVFNSIN
jgi:hypothetical protein